MEEENKPQTPIEMANAAAENLRNATKEMKEQLDRQEAMKAASIIAGETSAGEEVKPKEVSDVDYANKVMANEDA